MLDLYISSWFYGLLKYNLLKDHFGNYSEVGIHPFSLHSLLHGIVYNSFLSKNSEENVSKLDLVM